MPELAKAVEALTVAVQTLADSPVFSKPGRDAFWPTMGLLLANLILAIAATWSAVHARRSADAAKELVQLTRQEFLAARTPRLVIESGGDVPQLPFHVCKWGVRNASGGPALDVQLSALTITSATATGESIPEPMWVDQQPHSVIHEAQSYPVILRTYQDRWTQSARLLVICHYRHLYQQQGQNSIYHTVLRAHALGGGTYQWEPQEYYSPEIPLPSDLEERCTACHPPL